ncbi:hypothetical protein BJV74DRAFT_888238 [Russula compacta]|nr:hypothetical protein BJV74DRAFT_888238 [Russula compacta]
MESSRGRSRSVTPEATLTRAAGPNGRSARSPPPTLTSPVLASLKANSRAKQGAWCRGPPSIGSIASPPASRAPTLGSRPHSARGSASSTGQTRRSRITHDQVDRFETEQDEDGDGPPTPSTTSAYCYFGSDRCNKTRHRHITLDPEGPIDAERDYDNYEEYAPKFDGCCCSAHMMDLFDSAPRASSHWEGYTPDLTTLPADSHLCKGSPDPPPPPPPAPVSPGSGGRVEHELFLDEEGDMQPKVNLARRAKSIIDTEGDDDEEGLGEGDDARSSVSSAWTTRSRTRTNDTNVSQSIPASGTGCQHPQKLRRAAEQQF